MSPCNHKLSVVCRHLASASISFLIITNQSSHEHVMFSIEIYVKLTFSTLMLCTNINLFAKRPNELRSIRTYVDNLAVDSLKAQIFSFSDYFGEFLVTFTPKEGSTLPEGEEPLYLLDRGLAEKVKTF